MQFKLFTILILVAITVAAGCVKKEVTPITENHNKQKNIDDTIDLESAAKEYGFSGTIVPRDEVFIEERTEEEIRNMKHEYAVRVLPAASVIKVICPGVFEAHSFTIKNTGENPDSYLLTGESSMGWGDFSSLPTEVSLDPGEEVSFKISIHVPATASSKQKDEIAVVAISQTNSNLLDSSSVYIDVCK